jgi:hypothetical protein
VAHSNSAFELSVVEAKEVATTQGFADRVKTLIRAVGSVTEIARRCGFSEGVVRSWRDGHTDPSRNRCVVMAKALGISLLWLVAGEGPIQTESMSDGFMIGEAATNGRRHSGPMNHHQPVPQLDPGVMNAGRLSTAVQILQTSFDLVNRPLSLSEHADLLAELYAVLDQADGQTNNERVLAFRMHLLQRLSRTA